MKNKKSNNDQNLNYEEEIENLDTTITEINDNETYSHSKNEIYEEVEIKKRHESHKTDSYFDGGLLELIGWFILKYLITIFTLGIARPWGECMLIRYQTNHTVLNGKRLKFEGSGGSLFVEIFKWLFFSIITLGIYVFWVPVKKYKWILSNIHFEEENLIKGESYFDGKTLHYIGISILCNILNILSFGLLYAFTLCFKLKWLAKHSIINRKKIVFDGKAINLFVKYIVWFFLTLITFGIYGFWLGIKLSKWEVKHSHIKALNEQYHKDNLLFFLVVLLAFILLIVLMIIPNLDIEAISNGIINNEFFKNIFGEISTIESNIGEKVDTNY